MELSVREQQNSKKEMIFGFLEEMALIWLISGCGIFCAAGLFLDEISLPVLLGAAGAGAVLCAGISRMPHGTVAGALAMPVLILVGVVFPNQMFLNGMTGVWNQIAETFGKNTEVYLPKYQVLSEESLKGDQAYFLICLVICTSILVFGMLKLRLNILCLLTAFGLTGLSFYLGKSLPDGPCFFYFAGVVLAERYMLLYGKRRVLTENRHSVFAGDAALFLVLVVLAAGSYQMAVPKLKYSEASFLAGVRRAASDTLETWRFQTGRVNSLPKGNLAETGPWTASEDTALKVTMEEPESLYLRGFTGSTYQGEKWEPLSREVCYESRDMFYWLHKRDFYGESQLAGIRKLVSDETLSSDTAEVQVENIKADRQYLYIPYEITGLPEEFAGECAYGDAFLKSKGLLGTTSYSFTAMGNLTKDFPKIAAQGYLALKEEENAEYREQESYYNAFVYKNHTELSDRLKKLFQTELGTAGDQKKGHLDYYSAITHIREYLEEHMTYGTQTETLPQGQDFAEYFLTESGIGHSVHYATAAALMFRYYGIPSRYAEGYLVTPEDVQGAEPGTAIEISGKNGHAWTEIYVDGTGWVPVEMTPEYYGVMEEPDLSLGLETSGTRTAARLPETEEEAPPLKERSDLRRLLSLAFYQLGRILLILLVLFDSFCLLFFLWVVILRLAVNRKRRKAFADRDNKRAVCQMVRYAEQLYQHRTADFSNGLEAQYQGIYRIGEKAAFSRHEISPKEREAAEECIRLLLGELKKMRGWYDRWIMKYIERLY